MSGPRSVDDLYETFARALPHGLTVAARALPFMLRLAPVVGVSWGEVFTHEPTLSAPRLVVEAMPGLPDTVVEDAALAHLLAVVGAFGADRILDGQVERAPELDAILMHARCARDEALARVVDFAHRDVEVPVELDPALSYARADDRTMAAIRAEHAILGHGETVSWSRYLAISYAKQRIGLPASLALAYAAGWDARRRRALARLLDTTCVGLQIHDDVVDWEDDLAHGGAWAASLAAYAPRAIAVRDRKTIPVSTRRLVFESKVLPRMLRHSARCFRAARRRAQVLGAARFAAWAFAREAQLGELWREEAAAPGRTNRARALSAWVNTVLDAQV